LSYYASTLLPIPSPCGLAISSVTGDGKNLYALQPDRKTVYKLDECGRIICVFKTTRRYTSIHYCGDGRFYAVNDCTKNIIYILNKCFAEVGISRIEFPDGCNNACRNTPCGTANGINIGPSGSCGDAGCIIAAATKTDSYAVTPGGRIISALGSAGQNFYYTAIAENNGILYEGLESRYGNSTYVRATLLTTGQSKLQQLPFGYRVRSFFCHGGRFYAFVTQNSYHAYVAAVCTYIYSGVLGGEIIALPDVSGSESCCEESCNFGTNSKCTCGAVASCGACGVSSNQTEMCNNAVSGESTENTDCDVDELCRLFNCIKKLCSGNSCNQCGSNTCGCGTQNGCGNVNGGQCCPDGTLNCTCFPTCECDNTDVGGITCLPLPPCPPCEPCVPCEPCSSQQPTRCCGDGNLKISLGGK